MRTFSTFLLAVCAAAGLTAHAPAQEITPADKASVDAFLKTCAPQIAAMRKEMAAHGETLIDRELRDYFEVIPAQMREVAQRESMSLRDVLPEAISMTRQAMNDPASTDPSEKVIGPTMICFLEMLIAGETGQPARRLAAEAAPPPAPAPRPAPRPAPAPAPAPPVSTAQAVADSGGCLTIDWRGAPQGAPAILTNLCNHPLNVAVCIEQPTPGSVSEHLACEQSRFTSYFIGARRSVTVPATHGPSVSTRVCTHPQFPAVWWENGTSVGNCR